MQNDGYDVDIIDGKLVVRHVPYVNEKREVVYGILVSDLDLVGDATTRPKSHVVNWMGDYPCFKDGRKMESLVHSQNKTTVGKEIVTSYRFSQKPPSGYYDDYYSKMSAYIRILESEAKALDANATAQTFPVIKNDDAPESVFYYTDTSSSRSGITSLSKRLESSKIAIVGLGGTGSYILDMVAKTHVPEIHLFDGDYLLQHNAFRSPGAFSAEELGRKIKKVEWFNEVYSKFRRGIFANGIFLDASNLDLLNPMDFVFLCIDQGTVRKLIVEHLLSSGIPFIDTGVGVHFENGQTLSGQVRVTSASAKYNLDSVRRLIPMGRDADNEYSSNIQIAELNALNAALAVIKWKKLSGLYSDSSQEFSTVYMISENLLLNEVQQNEAQEDPT